MKINNIIIRKVIGIITGTVMLFLGMFFLTHQVFDMQNESNYYWLLLSFLTSVFSNTKADIYRYFKKRWKRSQE